MFFCLLCACVAPQAVEEMRDACVRLLAVHQVRAATLSFSFFSVSSFEGMMCSQARREAAVYDNESEEDEEGLAKKHRLE